MDIHYCSLKRLTNANSSKINNQSVVTSFVWNFMWEMVKPTDSHIVAQVKILRDEGLTFQVISEKLGLRNRQAAFSPVPQKFVLWTKKASRKTIKANWQREKATCINCSRSTIPLNQQSKEHLQQFFSPCTWWGKFKKKYNLRRRSAAKTLQLARLQRQNRVDWCRRRFSWFVEQRQSVIFSDEVRFCLKSGGIVKVWRPQHRRFDPRYTVKKSKDRRSIMFWGFIRHDGYRLLLRCPEPFTSSDYLIFFGNR